MLFDIGYLRILAIFHFVQSVEMLIAQNWEDHIFSQCWLLKLPFSLHLLSSTVLNLTAQIAITRVCSVERSSQMEWSISVFFMHSFCCMRNTVLWAIGGFITRFYVLHAGRRSTNRCINTLKNRIVLPQA